MSDQIPAFPETTSAAARPGGLTRIAVIVALCLGLVGAGAFASSSFSQGFGSPFGFGPGPGFGPGFGFGHGHWRGGPFGGGFDPARAEERADRMIRHISVEVDATAEQQEKVPMREKLFAARTQARDLLLAQNIDRAAIEKLRTDQLAVADALSKRFTQALIDAAEVLNPDQRHKLEAMLPPVGHWRGWSRG
jgi:protein CpxP